MIINTEEIKLLLKENTAYKLGKELNVSRQNLNNYKNGTYSIEKMTIELALKLQNLYNKLEKNNMNIINEVRKELETGSYYVEDYANFNELLEERGMTLNEYNEKITEVNHEIIEDAPVIVYENPESTLFNVAYVTERDTVESIINQLK